jgi:hypothetical protein
MTRSRRGRRALPALGLLLASLAATGQALAGPSGLAWTSGARVSDLPSCLAALRKRPLDVAMTFANHGSWAQLEGFLAGPFWKARIRAAPIGVVSLALLPEDHPRQFAQCNAGKFDAEYGKIGTILAQSGAGQLIVRLGWEANTAGSHAWVPTAQADIGAFKQCWIRARNIIHAKLGAHPHKFEQSLAKNGRFNINQMTYWVGRQYADILGAHYYDSGFVATTSWAAASVKTGPGGGPQGITTWYNAARTAGVRLAVPEWALWNVNNPHPDDPTYLHNMKAWFKAHAAGLAYETYFNVGASHQLCSTTRYPKGRAAYASDWGAG